MNLGFLIDNRKCIGCHACSTACKQENEVPLGVNRTWVKYVEKGAFPDARRFFQVTRCNHCANPPCVRICPVTAMYQRTDGIVEFDGDVCIGCKACIQACPYDAIYMDPDTGTAAKCHFCSHRTDLGLEPACGVVCPTQAIVSGDLDDPSSTIRQLLGRHDVSVRKPEQGTLPKLFYIDADAVTLVPTASPSGDAFMWADRDPAAAHVDAAAVSHTTHGAAHATPRRMSASGTPLRTPVPQGAPATGPIAMGGTMAGHMVQTGYNAQQKPPWHWPVPAYLVTKAIGSGAFMLLAAFAFTGKADDPVWATMASAIAALFTGITAALLVLDLDRPERFLRILTRPQWRSWLTRGAFILLGFGVVATLNTALAGATWAGLVAKTDLGALRALLLGLGGILAVLSAAYTAFLFGQAEGRDLWQSPLLPAHLVVQAIAAGAAGLLVLDAIAVPLDVPFADAGLRAFGLAFWAMAAALILNALLIFGGEMAMPHTTPEAAMAARAITHGRYRRHFWWGAVVVGHVVPLAIVALLWAAAGLSGEARVAGIAVAGAATIVGLFCYEYAYVMAPQDVPNS
ncbi:MAG: NrfD/PsrC family molybdoenzyme membrane anchor subunit [Ardenticatenales bacterium]